MKAKAKVEAEEEVSMLKEELEAIQARLKAMTDKVGPEVAEEVGEYVDQASSVLKSYVDGTASALKEKWDTTKEKSAKGAKKANEYAHENPWHIAAAGALVGMAVASLLRRDRDKE